MLESFIGTEVVVILGIDDGGGLSSLVRSEIYGSSRSQNSFALYQETHSTGRRFSS